MMLLSLVYSDGYQGNLDCTYHHLLWATDTQLVWFHTDLSWKEGIKVTIMTSVKTSLF